MITNKKVLEFLDSHPHIDANVLMLLAIEMYDYVLSTQTNVNVNQISKYLVDNSNKLDNLLKQNNDLLYNLQEVKTSYVNEVKNIIYNSDNTQRIVDGMRNNNFLLINATKEILSEVVNNLTYQEKRDLEMQLKSLETNITIATSNLVKSLGNESALKDFTSTINSRCIELSSNMFNILNSSEQRLSNRLDEIKDLTSGSMNLNNNVSQLLDKFNNSCQKGKISEMLLSNLLTKMYPSAEVQDMSEQNHSCDLKLIRLGKSDILFENKNYSTNVKTEEVNKFRDDMKKHEQNGIMLSQNSGIINKKDFEIEILNKKVLVYLHNVDYDKEKIKLAVDIIDNISETIKDVDEKDSVKITSGIIKEINIEYLNFIKQRESLIAFMRDTNNEAIIKIKNLQFPQLQNLFVKRTEIVKEKTFNCNTCKNFNCTNRKELNEHKKECGKN